MLGYRLVRGMARGRPTATFRDLLVRSLHDIGAVARAAGMGGSSGGRAITLQRPATAVVIPEVTFTWDEGTVIDLSRRLVIPNTRSEH